MSATRPIFWWRSKQKKPTWVPVDRPLKIIPGMTVTVDIITGKKTVLNYLLKPILRARQNALTES